TRDARLDPGVGPGRPTIRAPWKMTERPAARDQHVDRHVRADEADAVRRRAVRCERIAEAVVDCGDRCVDVDVHYPSHRGKPSAITGNTISSTRCMRSATRNGSTPLKMRPSETSGTTPCI